MTQSINLHSIHFIENLFENINYYSNSILIVTISLIAFLHL